MLYEPQRFEPLTDAPWDEEGVRTAIRAIVADADEAFDPDALWPADEWDAWQTPTPLTSLYVGAAGMLWAIDAIVRRGLAQTRIDLAAAARRALELWGATPGLMAGVELPEPARAGLLAGETGLLAVAWRLAPDRAVADVLHDRVGENVDNADTGIMWGSPGTMLIANAFHDWTGEPRWVEAWRDSASRLLARRRDDGLWEQRLYGERFLGLGAVYGLVGNVLALLRGPGSIEVRSLPAETAAVLHDTAVIEDGLVNWPSAAGGRLRGTDGELRLQWCCGAPGVVSTAGAYMDEGLLDAASETIWRAGAHGDEKGSSICHGTAGNGYALLAAFERTRDERWLARARRFAVHALEQAARARRRRGRGRYSLWTGDVGVALFASDCLTGAKRYPILDAWE
jgi:hypothetical protein